MVNEQETFLDSPAATAADALKISLSQAGPTKEISVLRVDGVVDTMTAGELERVVTSLLARQRYRLVIDLAGVDYISSAGWGIFVARLREIREHGGDIKLARMTPEVREIYELLEFDELLPSFQQLERALEAFSIKSGGTSQPAVAGAAESPTVAETTTGIESDRAERDDGEVTLDEAVRRLITEDPFFTIGELRDEIRERFDDRFSAGWWKVFACLRRAQLLGRRARFRYFRQQRRAR